jgi:hypothetical protein
MRILSNNKYEILRWVRSQGSSDADAPSVTEPTLFPDEMWLPILEEIMA